MAVRRQLEFFLLRYAPDAVKDEFVNIGLVMLEPGANGSGFADVRFTRDWRRVLCLDSQADIEMLEALERDLRGQLGVVRDRELLLRRLQDSFSNIIQLSPTKACLAEEPAKEMDILAELYFAGPKNLPRIRLTGRQQILASMKDAFETANVLGLLKRNISTAPYTRPGDPFKIDFGYRVGDTVKFFHAVSLRAGVEQAIMLGSRYPKVAAGINKEDKTQVLLTAVVDDGLARSDERVQFALASLSEEQIRIAVAAEMPQLAETARKELAV